MSLDLEPVVPALAPDRSGVLRVGGTRVALEQVVREFRAGASPEEIADRFDVLKLRDVYSVLAWYLANRRAADAYVAAADEDEDRAESDASRDRGAASLRRRLSARRRRRGA